MSGPLVAHLDSYDTQNDALCEDSDVVHMSEDLNELLNFACHCDRRHHSSVRHERYADTRPSQFIGQKRLQSEQQCRPSAGN